MPGYVVRVPTARAVAAPLWEALCAAEQPMTVAELHEASRAHPNAVQLRLRRWVREGRAVEFPAEPARWSTSLSSAIALPATLGHMPHAVVAAIVVAGPSTVDVIAQTASMPVSSTRKALRRLERAGFARQHEGTPKRYAATDGTAPPSAVRRARTARDRLWTAMRVLKRFDRPRLEIAADVSRRAAEDFLNLLGRAGYLRVESRGNSTLGTFHTYLLVRATGPRTPVITHERGFADRRLRDPNTGETIVIPPARSSATPDAAPLSCARTS